MRFIEESENLSQQPKIPKSGENYENKSFDFCRNTVFADAGGGADV